VYHGDAVRRSFRLVAERTPADLYWNCGAQGATGRCTVLGLMRGFTVALETWQLSAGSGLTVAHASAVSSSLICGYSAASA
jgi:hypothetical protein